MLKKISDKIWQVDEGSCCYFLATVEPIIIDTGIATKRKEVEQELRKVVSPERVKKVILTHFHYDHVGNVELFPNAGFYASAEEIKDFKRAPHKAVANLDEAERFSRIIGRVHALTNQFTVAGLEVISTPGHTKGSVCLWYAQQKALFSGDTLFRKGMIGRTDLPTSVPEEMPKTLEKLKRYPYEILCPGHEY